MTFSMNHNQAAAAISLSFAETRALSIEEAHPDHPNVHKHTKGHLRSSLRTFFLPVACSEFAHSVICSYCAIFIYPSIW